jgi:hypothetical protein
MKYSHSLEISPPKQLLITKGKMSKALTLWLIKVSFNGRRIERNSDSPVKIQ